VYRRVWPAISSKFHADLSGWDNDLWNWRIGIATRELRPAQSIEIGMAAMGSTTEAPPHRHPDLLRISVVLFTVLALAPGDPSRSCDHPTSRRKCAPRCGSVRAR